MNSTAGSTRSRWRRMETNRLHHESWISRFALLERSGAEGDVRGPGSNSVRVEPKRSRALEGARKTSRDPHPHPLPHTMWARAQKGLQQARAVFFCGTLLIKESVARLVNTFSHARVGFIRCSCALDQIQNRARLRLQSRRVPGRSKARLFRPG